jgi:multifunctional beta-oxidation protein
VNDLSAEACDQVVKEIQQAGGKAAGAVGSVTDGEGIVKQAVEKFGTVHVLINNAGVLREYRAADERSERDSLRAERASVAFSSSKARISVFVSSSEARLSFFTSSSEARISVFFFPSAA